MAITKVTKVAGNVTIPFKPSSMYCDYVFEIAQVNDAVDTLQKTGTPHTVYLVEHNSKRLMFGIMAEVPQFEPTYVRSSRQDVNDEEEDYED